MLNQKSKSKAVSVSLLIKAIQNDPDFFQLPGEAVEPEKILSILKEKYHTSHGILEGFIDSNRIILQWIPETVHKEAEIYHQASNEFARKKIYDKAISNWCKAIELNPYDVEYLYKLAVIYFERKNYSDAIIQLEKVIQYCAIHHKALLLLGINWIKLRKFDKAERYVLAAIKLNSNNVLGYLNLGAIYSVQKRHNEAIDVFNQCIELSPTEARAYLGLARIYSILNDNEQANNFFGKVIELAPSSQMAEFAKRQIRYDTSEEKHSESAAKPVNREDQFAKGIGQYISGDYQKSSSQYKEYLQSNPNDDYAWYLLGESLLRTGELTEASDCFKRAVRSNGGRGIYYKSLGITLHYLGRSKEVIPILKKAIEMGKRDALTLTLQGVNFLRERKVEEGLNYLQNALKKNPNNPLAMYHIALIFMQTNRRDKANELIEKINSLEYNVPIKAKALNLQKNITEVL